MIYAKMIIVFTPNLEFSPYSEAMHGSAVFRLTKCYQRLKQNDDLFNLIFCSFFRFLSGPYLRYEFNFYFFHLYPIWGYQGQFLGM